MSLSLIARSIKESATLKLNEKAALMRAKGDPVIHLGGGEPKTRAPIDALVSAAALINSGEVRYTPADGIPTLKKAIIRYTDEWYGRIVEPENVIASSGAKQSIMVALQALVNPQEEVIYPSPYWVSYPEMIKLVGGIPVPVVSESGSFYPRLKDIEQVVTSYTKVIIINSPNNPTGVMYPEEFIAEIVEFCEKKGIYLIMDDIYHRLIFDNKKWVPCYKYAKDLSENSRLIVVNGVSKAYAMTGFRIGWAVANKKIIEAMTNIQSHQTSGASVVVQQAAVGALNGVQSCVDSLRVTLQNNCKVLTALLKTIDGVHLQVPDGTFYTFPDFSAFEKSSVKLANLLFEKVQVLVVPGIEFGMEGHIRISTCGTMKDITEGIERIKWVIDPNSPNELYLGDRKLYRDWS